MMHPEKKYIIKATACLLFYTNRITKPNSGAESTCSFHSLLSKKTNGCNEHPLSRAGLAHARQAPSCQPKDWFAPSLSRNLKEFCTLAVKQLCQWAAHTLKVAVLWWCWSRPGNVQHRDSFLLRPSQYWKNQSVNYNQWKFLLLTVSKYKCVLCFVKWWKVLVLPLVPGLSAEGTQEQGSRGRSLCPRGEWHT